MKHEAIVRRFEALFEDQGTEARARGSKAYMKSDLDFYGVTQAAVKSAAAEIARDHGRLDGKDVLAIARALYAKNNFDLRSGAIALLVKKASLLEPEDLPALITLVKASPCWAHVDWLATKVFPAPLAKLPEKKRAAEIRRWAKDQNLWVRRTALLVQHDDLKHGGGDFALFAEIAEPMLEEKVFWIRKAIGWVLREVSKKRPRLVADFVRAHGERMSGLTRREAEKYLPGARKRSSAGAG